MTDQPHEQLCHACRSGSSGGKSIDSLLTSSPRKLMDSAAAELKLGCLLGSGSFGKVYEGAWHSSSHAAATTSAFWTCCNA